MPLIYDAGKMPALQIEIFGILPEPMKEKQLTRKL